MDEITATELRLATELKNSFCDKSGKEINVVASAKIFHKLGLLYRKKSPDKISLIKSAGLFNASLARKPLDVLQIKSDLSELCQHILNLAQAKNQTLSLEKKAGEVSINIKKLRSNVKTFLNSEPVKEIPPHLDCKTLHTLEENKSLAIEHLNITIAERCKLLMAELSQFCQDVMGKPPCEYAVVGMGSLARNEITPYSDFEHVIVLFDEEDYETNLEYFRYFSVIFQVVVLNLQETIIPSLNIYSLNDSGSVLGDWFYDVHTPRGISFDGMMPHACKFPLGRQQHTKKKPWTTELILPVSKMLDYLSSDMSLKNGYHLADILTKTCFVFGNEDIFKQFARGVQKHQEKTSGQDIIDEVSLQVKEDLDNFSTRFSLSNLISYDVINIKRFMYRSTTLFLGALGKINFVLANSCFDIIKELASKNIFTQKTKHKLLFAIAVACELRLRVYTRKQSQCDNAFDLKNETSIQEFLNVVGVTSTLSYFQIAYC